MSIVVEDAPISAEQVTETPVVEQEVQQEVQAEPEYSPPRSMLGRH